MKKIILFVLIVIAISANAQKPSPLQISGSGWRYVGWFIDSTNFPYMEDMYTFIFNGDTTIASNLYYKYYFSLIHYNNGGSSDTVFKSEYSGCLRSVGEKVYFVAKDSLSELLLYDYALTIGDTVPIGLYKGNMPFVITDTTTIQMEDGSLRMKYLLNSYYPSFIIYGIGYNTGLLNPSIFEVTNYNGGMDFMTYCENGTRGYNESGIMFGPAEDCDFPLMTQIIDSGNTLDVYPNPASNRITVELSGMTQSGKIAIIDMEGQEFIARQITAPKTQLDISSLPSGVYFVRLTNEKTVEVGKVVKQ